MVGLNIRNMRKRRGLSLRKLASLASVSNSTLSDIENDNRNASIGTLNKLAIAMKCEPSEFYDDAINKEISEDEEIDLFTTRLVKELLDADMIKDVEHIPPEITDMLLKALVLDYKKKRDAKN